MNSTREQTLFGAASILPPPARAAYLDRECAGDLSLLARLDALLAAHDAPATALADFELNARSTTENPSTTKDGVAQSLGRYKLLEKLGEGGCGVVYVAEQTEPVRRRVALKVIKLGMDKKAVVARFDARSSSWSWFAASASPTTTQAMGSRTYF
jgi:hypothetical protein